MAKSGQVELYTTDFALDASGASYKGLIVVNKVYLYFKSSSLEKKLVIYHTLSIETTVYV